MCEAQKRKDNFGLDNPERVQLIEDNGESLYRKDRNVRRSTISVTHEELQVGLDELVRQIRRELDDPNNNCSCFSDLSKTYIPRNVFARILTPKRVLQLVLKLPCFADEPDKQRRAQDISYGSSKTAPFMKVLGVILGMGCPNEIMEYMKDGLNDDCFPLRYKYTKDHKGVVRASKLVCRHDSHNHEVIKAFDGTSMREYTSWARRLTSPYIKWQGSLHSHYRIESGDPLPMYSGERRQQTPEDEERTTDELDGAHRTDESLLGGYSEIFKVLISDSHFNFGNNKFRNRDGYYALKKLSSHSRKIFNLELSSLLFAADQRGSKKHLIQLLATFEEYNPTDKISTWYLLFNWAEGDLNHFWKANQRLVGDASHCLWMAEQFYGLAEALQIVHNDRKVNLRHLPESNSDMDLYGRHGDIKPDNLLWFPGNTKLSSTPVLTLADFGLGRLHTRVSRSKQDPSLLSRSATYRSPEFDLPDGLGLVSPVSDIFSLGCVYLEYLSWYLLGYKAGMKEFSKWRLESDIHTFLSDTFFRVSTGPDGIPTPSLKPAVTEWIQKLREHAHCTSYIEQMLSLIEDEMLNPKREDRIKASPLAKRLETLMVTCRREPSFYTTKNNSRG